MRVLAIDLCLFVYLSHAQYRVKKAEQIQLVNFLAQRLPSTCPTQLLGNLGISKNKRTFLWDFFKL